MRCVPTGSCRPAAPTARSEAEKQSGNGNETPAHGIGREPQSFKRVRSEKRLSPRLTKDHEGEFRASVHPDPGAPHIPLDLAAIRKDEGVPRVRDYPKAVE